MDAVVLPVRSVSRDANFSSSCLRSTLIPAAVPDVPDLAHAQNPSRAKPVLRIRSEPSSDLAVRAYRVVHRFVHLLIRFFRGERHYSGWGVVDFFEDRIEVARDPVADAGESSPRRFSLGYGDIVRIEFVTPCTIVLAWGLVTREAHRQVVLSMGPLEVRDKFDAMVALIEDRCDAGLVSILDDTRLTHTRPWTWEERFPGLGSAESVFITFERMQPDPTWSVVTDDGSRYESGVEHGLALRDSGGLLLMQALRSQVLDADGVTLSLIDRTEEEVGIRVDDLTPLAIRAEGEVLLRNEILGRCDCSRPPGVVHLDEPTTATSGGHYAAAAVAHSTVPAPMTIRFYRPVSKAWALALAMVSLLSGVRGQGSLHPGSRDP